MFHIPFSLISCIGLMLGLQSIKEKEGSENDFNHFNLNKPSLFLVLLIGTTDVAPYKQRKISTLLQPLPRH